MIVLEGPDGGGKTTLANQICKIFDLRYFHPGPAPKETLITYNANECLIQLCDNAICDRITQISEYIYGPVINNRNFYSKNDVRGFIKTVVKYNWQIIYCKTYEFEPTYEEYDTDIELLVSQYNKVYALYEAFMSNIPETNLILYDFNDPYGFQNVILTLKERLPQL